MGIGKKDAAKRKDHQDGMGNVHIKGVNFFRDAKKIRTLKIQSGGSAQRNASGKITKAANYQSRELPKARVEPNRKWFGNTRVISQDALQSFRTAIEERASDPYQVLLKTNKLPLSLVREPVGKNGLKQHQAKIAVENSSFSMTFGPKATRKRSKMAVSSLEELAEETSNMHETYLSKIENDNLASGGPNGEQAGEAVPEKEPTATAREPIFSKGQSKRIWNELYKVIDSSDVVIHVLDARDPSGTRCRGVEKYIRQEQNHKHLIFVLNKCDLVPTGVAASWVRALSKEYPTVACHASITNSFGKGSIIQLLRQFSSLHASRKQISVGFIGYPNTGKSSIINTLRKKRVCTVSSISGETKVWQYITLMKRIYLIDCPGVVPPNPNDTEEDLLLRGVCRVENVESPEQYIDAVLKRVKLKHIERTYAVKDYANSTEFLEMLARRSGRLLRGGEADLATQAKMVLNDFLRGKLPWFTDPPSAEGKGVTNETADGKQVKSGVGLEGRKGALGEMRSAKRKRETMEEEAGELEEMANDEEDVRAAKDPEDDDGSSDEYDEGEEGSDPEKEAE